MPKMTILDNEFASLWFYPETKVVHQKAHKFMHAGQRRTLFVRGVECLERHNATKWLSDIRRDTVLRPREADWADAVWAPRALRAGFKYWAIVLSPKDADQMEIRQMVEDYRRRGVTVRPFSETESAMRWLESADEAQSPHLTVDVHRELRRNRAY